MESAIIFVGCVVFCSWHFLFGVARADRTESLGSRRRQGRYVARGEPRGSSQYVALGLVGALVSGCVWLLNGAPPATVVGTALLFVGITLLIRHLYWDSVRDSGQSRDPQPAAKRSLTDDLGEVALLVFDILLLG